MPIIGEDVARLEVQFIVSPKARFREGAVAKTTVYTPGEIVKAASQC
jgi:hypothetical protein